MRDKKRQHFLPFILLVIEDQQVSIIYIFLLVPTLFLDHQVYIKCVFTFPKKLKIFHFHPVILFFELDFITI